MYRWPLIDETANRENHLHEISLLRGLSRRTTAAVRKSFPGLYPLCAGIIVLAMAGNVRAEVLANTLNSPSLVQVNKSGGAAQSFDAVIFDLKGATAVVESVSLPLKNNTGSPTEWIAAIFSSPLTNTAPTTFVQDLGKISTTSSTSFVKTTFTPASPIPLAANLRYWVIYGNATNYQGAYQTSTAPSNSASVSAVTVFISAATSTGMVGRWRSAAQNTILQTMSGITLTGGSTSTTVAPIFEMAGTMGPTLVVLYDFYLQSLPAGEVQVCWQTASEDNTLGFDLYRWGANGWVKVNAAMIPAQGWPQGGIGARYCVDDPGANATDTFRYKLVEFETTGAVREYGPFERSAWMPRLSNFNPTPGGLVIQWLSREAEVYDVLKASDLRGEFTPMATGLPATPPLNSWTDRAPSACGFYRVEAQ